MDKLNVFKIAMRILLEEEDEAGDIIKNANLLLKRFRQDMQDSRTPNGLELDATGTLSTMAQDTKRTSSNLFPVADDETVRKSILIGGGGDDVDDYDDEEDDDFDSERLGFEEARRALCDDILRDAISSCREPDYKMELAKLLSNEAKIELYIEIGKLSNAQMLACNLNRPDYVTSIIEKANELNQNHVKTVCQLWLAKHEATPRPANDV